MKRKQPTILVNPPLRAATRAELTEYANAAIVLRHAHALMDLAYRIERRLDRARSSKARAVKL